jgi:hypothetical protein
LAIGYGVFQIEFSCFLLFAKHFFALARKVWRRMIALGEIK